VAATGFRSATRLAGSDAQMMLDILLTNQAPVLETIDDLHLQLDHFAGLIAAGDEQALRRHMIRIRALRNEFIDRYGV